MDTNQDYYLKDKKKHLKFCKTLIKVKKKNNDYQVSELFKPEEFGAHTKPALFYNGYFYVQYEANKRRDGMVCMNMEGEIMWNTKRDPDSNKGSMIVTDGLILASNFMLN